MNDGPRPPSLHVLTGLHAGAERPLPAGPLSIGSEPPADVLLSDENVAPQHLVIERDGNGLRFSVKAEGVKIEGTQLSAGDVVAAVPPVDVDIGGVGLRCEAGQEAAPPKRPNSWNPLSSRSSAVGAGAALGVLLIVGVAMQPAAGAFVLPRAVQALAAPRDKASQGATGSASTTDATLQSETRQQLQASGLSEVSLSVSNGVVTAQGQVDPASLPRLHDVELWFDRRFGEAAVFISQVTAQAARKFTIQLDAVWAGPDPNVVVHGQKYSVGASLPDGTTIDQITSHQVLFTQNGQHYAINY